MSESQTDLKMLLTLKVKEEPQAKERRWPQEIEKDKETGSPLETLERTEASVTS